MSRWIDMREQGWRSADDHLHIPRPPLQLNPFISKWKQAEDLHVANLLQLGNPATFHERRAHRRLCHAAATRSHELLKAIQSARAYYRTIAR